MYKSVNSVKGIAYTRWTVSWQQDGKRLRRHFKTKKEAAAFEIDLQKVPAARRHLPRKITPQQVPTATFEMLVSRYRKDSVDGRQGRRQWKVQTARSFDKDMDMMRKSFDFTKQLIAISKQDIRNFNDAVLDRDLSRSTASRLSKHMTSILKHAVNLDLISQNPATGITITLPRGKSHKRVDPKLIPLPDEVRSLIAAAEELRDSPRTRIRNIWARTWILPRLLFSTGLRSGEARALKWEDVNLDQNTIHVVANATLKGEMDTPKSRQGVRTIHFGPQLKADLIRLQFETGAQESDHILMEPDGSIPSYHAIRRRWEYLYGKTSFPLRDMHTARHYFATRHLDAGSDLNELYRALGHADPAFTIAVYGHLVEDKAAHERRQRLANTTDTFT
jgi:integrase